MIQHIKQNIVKLNVGCISSHVAKLLLKLGPSIIFLIYFKTVSDFDVRGGRDVPQKKKVKFMRVTILFYFF